MDSPQQPLLDEKMSDFVHACVNGKFDEVKAMIETSDQNNRRKLFSLKDADNGRNSLHWAVYHCNIEAMKYLLTFREVGIYSTDREGKTVFTAALNPGPAVPIIKINNFPVRSPTPTITMLKTLLEADKRLIKFRNQPNPLSYAVRRQSIEVIKFVIQLDHENKVGWYRVGNDFGYNILHEAAHCMRVDVIRFLLRTTKCDQLMRDINRNGFVPCFLYFRRVAFCSLTKDVTEEKIDFCMEFISLTFKSPEKCYEVHLLLFQCIERKDMFNERTHLLAICQRFATFLIAYAPDKCLVDLVKQLSDANFGNYFTLISLLMYKHFLLHFSDAQKSYKCYDIAMESSDPLLEELLNLYLVNEQLANEFVRVMAKTSFGSIMSDQLRVYMPWKKKQVALQTIYNFAKMLVRNGVNIFEGYYPIHRQKNSKCEYPFRAIAPLCNFVRVPLGFALSADVARSVCAFNESEYWIEDYRNCKNGRFSRGVVSLKNLARTTVRKHLFQNGNVYEKLTALHSMELPSQIINFICYNDYNLKL